MDDEILIFGFDRNTLEIQKSVINKKSIVDNVSFLLKFNLIFFIIFNHNIHMVKFICLAGMFIHFAIATASFSADSPSFLAANSIPISGSFETNVILKSC
jgi:hypothetical protein